MEGSTGGGGLEEGGSGVPCPLKQEAPEVSSEAVSGERTGRERRKKKRLRNEPQSITEVPCRGVGVLDFAEARATEMSNMLRALRSKGGSKRTFQKLPCHMRRRAMSHNVKRLPRRMREAARKEMEKQEKLAPDSSTKKKKPPSRKQRRKTRNLRDEYSRRQRKYVWLETHLWHAKRMRMVDKYGYRLAEHTCDKGVRATYKSLVHGCLLSDISYYCCVEVSGKQRDVTSSVSPLFSSDTGLTIGAKAYLSGQREGKAVAYNPGAYPHGAIGPVQFLWQPQPLSACEETAQADTISCKTKLWVFCHPAMFDELLAETQKAVEIYNSKQPPSQSIASESQASASVGATTSALLVSVRSLKDELVRFRLIGPRSHALLMETLKPAFEYGSHSASDLQHEEGAQSGSADDTLGIHETPKWWEDSAKELSAHAEIIVSCYPAIKSATTPLEFSRGAVIGMTVLDPRLFTPHKKTDMVSAFYPKRKRDQELGVRKYERGRCSSDSSDSGDSEVDSSEIDSLADVEEEDGEVEVPGQKTEAADTLAAGDCTETEMNIQDGKSLSVHVSSLPKGLSYCPIWEESIRKLVSESKIPEHVLNDLRSKQFPKSSELNLGNKASRIPILLVHQSPQMQIMPLAVEASCSSHSIYKSTNSNLGTGWDIIIPRAWAMAFWVALVYRGARACGMNELQKCSLEVLAPTFPQDYPYTRAGQEHSRAEQQLLEERYRKYPPDKRLNYGKLLIESPFYCPWEELVGRWNREAKLSQFLHHPHDNHDDNTMIPPATKKVKIDPEASEEAMDASIPQKCDLSPVVRNSEHSVFYVLRSREALSKINQFLQALFITKGAPVSNATDLHTQLQETMRQFGIDKHLQEHTSALIPVKLEILRSGNVSERACISIPTASDLKALVSDKSYHGPVEPIHPKGTTVVEGKNICIGVSLLSKKEVKEVRKQRAKKKAELGKSCDDSSSIKQAFKLCPVVPSRSSFGFVTLAGCRSITSKYGGIGFVTFAGLLAAAQQCFMSHGVSCLLALIRGETVNHYFVKLSLLH